MRRLRLALLSFSIITLLLVAQCFFSMRRYLVRMPDDYQKYNRRELGHMKEILNLKKTQLLLERRLEEIAYKYNKSRTENERLHRRIEDLVNYERYIDSKIDEAEIIQGQQLKTEYDIPPFNRFNVNHIFIVDPGLGKRVMEKPIAYKRKDLQEVVDVCISTLNANRSNAAKRYSFHDFSEGIYRTTPSIGSQYELYFRHLWPNGSTSTGFHKIAVVRPFSPLKVLRNRVTDSEKEWINMIVPLSGRVIKFKRFMNRFVKTCIRTGERVFLTVVYFGAEGFDEVKATMAQISREHSFNNMKLLNVLESFSRGRGLQNGVMNWKGGDVLLFFCDVDIVFGSEFLKRCRLNAERGSRVYFPIVFSLYNPNVVYKLHDIDVPLEKDQLTISQDTGFWREFGYGMTCQYRSDFLSVHGFTDKSVRGWGGEDVHLYHKYIKSKHMVVRATDPDIFHLWHEKICEKNLSSKQYHNCIRSKALNEA